MSKRSDTPEWLKDGSLAFHGGVDASIPASDIARNQVVRAINCTMRGGTIKPRPGWKLRPLTFESDEQRTAFRTSIFQRGSFYASGTNPSLISSIGGRLFLINLIGFTVQEITPLHPDTTIDRNSATTNIGWSVQMGTYWAYQDNSSWPIIFNGNGCRRSNPAKSEIPVGNVMAYAEGRLLVALPDRHSYRVGDLLFGPSGTQANGYKDAVLRFTENSFLNEGGDFQARVFGAPSNDGPITAMKAVAMPDTQLGQGPVMIGTPYNVFTLDLPFDRTTWKDLANPQQTNSPLLGPMGQDSMVLVNTDVWYRSMDGIRSYILARRAFNAPGNTPMSSEIYDLLGADTQSLLEHGSGVLFDNRLLQTVSPAPSSHGIYHRGLAVMDFNLVSTVSKKLPMVWEGLWKDLRILQIMKGMVSKNERCFAYVLNCDDEIELWELTKDSKFDGNHTPITWSYELPSYNCGNSDQFKKLETSRIIVNNLVGELTGTVTYRSDQNPCWTDWDTFTRCAKKEDCCVDQTTTVTTDFNIPAIGLTVQIVVGSTVGMSDAFPEITIGGYTLSLVTVDDSVTVTLLNSRTSQENGLVPHGTLVEFCGFDCAGPHTYREQSRLIRLASPPDTADPISGHFYNKAYEFQPRHQFTGSAEVRQVRIYAKDEPEMLGINRRDEV